MIGKARADKGRWVKLLSIRLKNNEKGEGEEKPEGEEEEQAKAAASPSYSSSTTWLMPALAVRSPSSRMMWPYGRFNGKRKKRRGAREEKRCHRSRASETRENQNGTVRCERS